MLDDGEQGKQDKSRSSASRRMTKLEFVKDDKVGVCEDDKVLAGSGLAEGGGDQGAAEEFWVAGQVVGGDFGELLFDEDEGGEVEALDFGAGLHVVASDGSAESGDEGLRVDGVVGGGFGVGVGYG